MAHLSASIVERVPAETLLRATRAPGPRPLLTPWTPWTPLCSLSEKGEEGEGVDMHPLPSSPQLPYRALPHPHGFTITSPSPDSHSVQTANQRRSCFHSEICTERVWNPCLLQRIPRKSSSSTRTFDFNSAWNTWYELKIHILINTLILTRVAFLPQISYGLCSARLNYICFCYYIIYSTMFQ